MPLLRFRRLLALPFTFLPVVAFGAQEAPRVGYTAEECAPCAGWNAPASPLRVHGNTYYVGTRGLSAILVTSDAGHVLLDAGLPESAEPIMASIRALGFRVEEVRLIVVSHAHYDHAGGIAAIQRASGASVAAVPWSAQVLRTGQPLPDDPQYEIALPFPAVAPSAIREIADGDTLRVGPIAVVAHLTAGHTPGGMSFTWRSCDGPDCRDLVYADSQTPVSADGFSYTRGPYASAVRDFERSFAVLERLSCDVLLTPHPGASGMWERFEASGRGEARALGDGEGCRRYAANARAQLAARIARESQR